MTKWISVKKTLPNVNGTYLCVFDGWDGRSYIKTASFTTNLEKLDEYDFKGEKRPGWYGYDSEWGFFEYDSITHWMPLPELPKEE